MPDDLREKLVRGILENLLSAATTYILNGGKNVNFIVTPYINQIHQAYVNAGYKQVRLDEPNKTNDLIKLGDEVRQMFGIMTGKEWYERFEKEFEKKNFKFLISTTEYTVRAIAEDAAQRAAGLE